jgi:hypothetical protein
MDEAPVGRYEGTRLLLQWTKLQSIVTGVLACYWNGRSYSRSLRGNPPATGMDEAPVGRYEGTRLLLEWTKLQSIVTGELACYWNGRKIVLLAHTVWKQQAFRVTNSNRVDWANAFVKSSFTFITFLAELIFWSVGSTDFLISNWWFLICDGHQYS